MVSRSEIQNALEQTQISLLAQRNEQGHWEGELSTSALSTANAIVALSCVDKKHHSDLIQKGIDWLQSNQNEDGGWGDTTKSFSNVSTTLLCWSALKKLSPSNPAIPEAEHWIIDYVGSLSPEQIAETVKARYGKDRTFSVPILMLCSICGTLGKNGWKRVLSLPFELAAFPREWFATMRLPVVSYALPALIAIGFARFTIAPPALINPLRWIRQAIWPRVSKLLTAIQPESGGFLEAAPLTGFVTMALASAGEKDHPVVKKGVEFLVNSIREDGSWPIDTNLATWATTLSVKALLTQQGTVPDLTLLPQHQRDQIRQWLLNQQYRVVHPFTNSPPGGWAWTDLSGGVPDADDTPGALLALKLLADKNEDCRSEAEAGIVWLLDLQNRDGGIPTFCRGWGALPFDRSSPDLTAHTLRAWSAWYDDCDPPIQHRIDQATRAAIAYLAKTQNSDGSWMPLWFGNQHRNRDEANPTYGTAMVTIALRESMYVSEPALLESGLRWLKENQNSDGGWGSGKGTPSTIEETALALRALPANKEHTDQVDQGLQWLIQKTEEGTKFPASPIGFYFAKLWYFEKIYPLVWTADALRHHAHVTATDPIEE